MPPPGNGKDRIVDLTINIMREKYLAGLVFRSRHCDFRR